MRTTAFAAAAVLSLGLSAHPMAAQSATWVSHDNGPSNARRGLGSVFRDRWCELWRTNAVAGPLVKDGIVAVQQDAAALATFTGLELCSGRRLWTTTAAEVGGRSWGCIAGKRFFVPCSASGAGSVEIEQRIECFDLHTGALVFVNGGPYWRSQTNGTVRDLQTLPGQGTEPDRIVFVAEDHPLVGHDWMAHVLFLDSVGASPAVEDIGPGVLDSWTAPLPAVRGSAKRAYVHDQEKLHINPLSSVSLREVDDVAQTETGVGLSQITLGTGFETISSAPLVLEPDDSRGYLADTGGYLYGFDFEPMRIAFQVRVATDTGNGYQDLRVALLSASGLVLVLEPNAPTGRTVRAYSTFDGTLVWSTATDALPANPLQFVVLDGDVVLLSLANGEVRALDAQGNLSAAVQTGTGTVLGSVEAVVGSYFLVSAGNELVCYENGCVGTPYGTASSDAHGCMPQIHCAGTPSLTSAEPFDICANQISNRSRGFLLYGLASANQHYLGGIRLVGSPMRIGPLQNSAGNPAPARDCSGAFCLDFNALLQSAPNPLPLLGQTVYCQFVYEDGRFSVTAQRPKLATTAGLNFTVGL